MHEGIFGACLLGDASHELLGGQRSERIEVDGDSIDEGGKNGRKSVGSQSRIVDATFGRMPSKVLPSCVSVNHS